MAEARLNKRGIAIRSGDITVYNYDAETREFLSSAVEFLTAGVGVPAHACTDAPCDAKGGFVICRTARSDGWELTADHRGETGYDTATGQPVDITAPGDYPDGVTPLAPSTPYDQWNGGEWVTDEAAQKRGQWLAAEQKKAALLTSAKNRISLWQTELQLGIISDNDKASLTAWMKYIQVLQKVDTSRAPDIDWPEPPE